MRKNVLLSVACILLLAMSALAQDKEVAKDAMPAPPAPLADDLFQWMVGEWEGSSTTAMGKSQDWQKVEMSLDNQWVTTHYTANMGAMKYKGMGPMTINPATNEVTGYWFDNFRGVYKGMGKRDGNKITMTWEGPMGTRTDTTEKVSQDKMVVTYTNKEPDGKVSEGRTELTRKKMAGKT